ncbi:MAG: hypothetical protein ACK551_05945 [Vampirovibrionales bacterium]
MVSPLESGEGASFLLALGAFSSEGAGSSIFARGFEDLGLIGLAIIISGILYSRGDSLSRLIFVIK